MTELKKQIEALLFSAGKAVDIVEISRLCREPDFSKIMMALEELKQEYEEKQGSLMIVRDGDFWKMVPREQYLPMVRKIVTKTELNKTIVETLATVAAKAPVLQSQIIKIRTNKAYDHLANIEEMGYITREKKGRTKLIKLTPKFFDYFDVPEGKVKEKFARVEELEQRIMQKEEFIGQAKENFEQRKEDHKLSDEEMKRLAEEEGKKLDSEIGTLETQIPPELLKEEPKIETYVDTLGQLEVFDESKGGAKNEKQAQERKDFKPKQKKEKIDWEKPKHEQPKFTKERKPEPAHEKIAEEETQEENKSELIEEQPKKETSVAEDVEEKTEDNEIETPKEKSKDEIEADAAAEKVLLEKQAASKGVFAEGMSEEVKKRVDEEVEAMTGAKKAAAKSEAAELEEAGEQKNADWQEDEKNEEL